MTKIKPCPFCGYTKADWQANQPSCSGKPLRAFLPKLVKEALLADGFCVMCPNCGGAMLRMSQTPKEAIWLWNMRAKEEQP